MSYLLTLNNSVHLKINIGSYMSAHVLLILLNELGKRDKMRGSQRVLLTDATSYDKILFAIKLIIYMTKR